MLLANRGNVVAVEVGETHEQPIVGDTLVLLKNAGLANVDYLQHRRFSRTGGSASRHLTTVGK